MSNVDWHVTQKFVILVPDPIAFASWQKQLSDFVETLKYWTLPKSCGSQSSEWKERKKSSAGERGWTKKAEAAHVFASRAFVTVTLTANMRGGMWTQIVYEGRATECTLMDHTFRASSCPTPDALDHARGTLEHDRRDRRGHALARW